MDDYAVKAAIKLGWMKANADKKWPAYDGTFLIRNEWLSASETDKCLRQLAFEKSMRGQKFNDLSPIDGEELLSDEINNYINENFGANAPEGFFARGHVVEDWVVQSLRAGTPSYVGFHFVGDQQRSIYSVKHGVSGTPDGWLVPSNSPPLLLEIKSTSLPAFEPMEAHVTQVQINMGLAHQLHEEGVYDPNGGDGTWPLGKPYHAMLIYVNSHNWFDIKVHMIEYDGGKTLEKAWQRSEQLFYDDDEDSSVRVVDPMTLPPEGLKLSGYMHCSKCPFNQVCADTFEGAGDFFNANKLDDERTIPVKPPQEFVNFFEGNLSTNPEAKVLFDFLEARSSKSKAEKAYKSLSEAAKKIVANNGGGVTLTDKDGEVLTVYFKDMKKHVTEKQYQELLDFYGLREEDFKHPTAVTQRFEVKQGLLK